MPINRKYPLAELLDACRAYPGLSNARRITFEYVMLKGVNDSLAEAKDLVGHGRLPSSTHDIRMEAHRGPDRPVPGKWFAARLDRGELLIGGQRATGARLDRYRESLGCLLQEDSFFSGSL